MEPGHVRSFFTVPVRVDETWWMQPGERFALEGLLAQLRPRLSVEIGTYDGGSLRRIAAHSQLVHCFDIDPRAQPHVDALDNAVLHLGDSAETLPRVLEEFTAAGEQVDFALVDGLHTYDAVIADASALLASPACERAVIVFHDSAHVEVRCALETLALRDHPKVAVAMLDFVPGYLVRQDIGLGDDVAGRGFNGLALVVLDPVRGAAQAETRDEFISTVALHNLFRAGIHGAPTGSSGSARPLQ